MARIRVKFISVQRIRVKPDPLTGLRACSEPGCIFSTLNKGTLGQHKKRMHAQPSQTAQNEAKYGKWIKWAAGIVGGNAPWTCTKAGCTHCQLNFPTVNGKIMTRPQSAAAHFAKCGN